MGCSTVALKLSVIIMNIWCAIFGAAMLAASVYCLNDFVDSEQIKVPCIVGIVIGSLLFLTIIPGCCGPYHESVRATIIYAISVWILMCAQIAVNIWLAVDFNALAVETINYAWRLDFTKNGTMAVYEVQYFCCGRTGPTDYISSGLRIPASCYKNQNSTLTENLYTTGCINMLQGSFEEAGRIELISDWTLVGVEAISVILAAMLAINLKNVERRKLFH